MKTKTIQGCRNALAATLVIGAFGGATIGCMPLEKADLSRYRAVSYSPNTNSTGLAGAWVLLFNNEFAQSPFVPAAFYQRQLIRFSPVVGAVDTYEITYCGGEDSPLKATVIASGDVITLPVPHGSDHLTDFSVIGNGRMTSTTTLYDEAEKRAVEFICRVGQK